VRDIGDMPYDIAALAEPLGCVMNGFCMNKTTKYSSQWEFSSYAEVSF